MALFTVQASLFTLQNPMARPSLVTKISRGEPGMHHNSVSMAVNQSGCSFMPCLYPADELKKKQAAALAHLHVVALHRLPC